MLLPFLFPKTVHAGVEFTPTPEYVEYITVVKFFSIIISILFTFIIILVVSKLIFQYKKSIFNLLRFSTLSLIACAVLFSILLIALLPSTSSVFNFYINPSVFLPLSLLTLSIHISASLFVLYYFTNQFLIRRFINVKKPVISSKHVVIYSILIPVIASYIVYVSSFLCLYLFPFTGEMYLRY